jgi:hypothetical protein
MPRLSVSYLRQNGVVDNFRRAAAIAVNMDSSVIRDSGKMTEGRRMKASKAARQPERPPRSFWFDPRFAIGIGLIAASVLGVLWLVAAADRTVPVYAAASELSAGDRIAASDLVEHDVRLGELGDNYLTVADLPEEGLVVVRSVSAGELVPMSAVGSGAGLRVNSVVVSIAGGLSRSIQPGAVVDLWSAREIEHGEFGPPAVLVSSATVVRVVEPEGFVAGGAARTVEVLVPRAQTARVLDATANNDTMSLVPVAIPVRG